MKAWFRLVAFLLSLVSASPAQAFFDDICFEDGRLVNCIMADPGCGLNSEADPKCLSEAQRTFHAHLDNLGSRSLIHTDAINLMAQAVGLEARVAYFLAAYSEAPDHAKFIYYARMDDGKFDQMPEGDYATIALDGLARDNVLSGGFIFHFPVVYQRPVGDKVDPTDTIHEGISRIRSWALQGPALRPCVGNLAALDHGSYFTGPKCYLDDPTHATTYAGGNQVNDRVDLGATKSGDQMLQTRPAKFAGDLQGLLDASAGRLADGSPVPEAIVRMGIYLHTLADRISHKPCIEGASLQAPSPGAKNFTKASDPANCGPALHAYRHLEEVGSTQLSPRTREALAISYAELAVFAKQNPRLVDKNARIRGQEEIVTALIDRVLNQTSAPLRLREMARLTYECGYVPLRLSPPTPPKNLSAAVQAP